MLHLFKVFILYIVQRGFVENMEKVGCLKREFETAGLRGEWWKEMRPPQKQIHVFTIKNYSPGNVRGKERVKQVPIPSVLTT